MIMTILCIMHEQTPVRNILLVHTNKSQAKLYNFVDKLFKRCYTVISEKG